MGESYVLTLHANWPYLLDRHVHAEFLLRELLAIYDISKDKKEVSVETVKGDGSCMGCGVLSQRIVFYHSELLELEQCITTHPDYQHYVLIYSTNLLSLQCIYSECNAQQYTHTVAMYMCTM